jgi:arsenite methyltransferase
VVGPEGFVIGVDCNQEMLALARRHQATVAQRLGYSNIEFRCGLIQDLRLDLDLLGAELARHPIRDQQGWLDLRTLEERLRRESPLIAGESVDCVVSSCVLNLVPPQDRRQLFAEVFRVLSRHRDHQAARRAVAHRRGHRVPLGDSTGLQRQTGAPARGAGGRQ